MAMWLFEWRCGCQDGDGSSDGEMAGVGNVAVTMEMWLFDAMWLWGLLSVSDVAMGLAMRFFMGNGDVSGVMRTLQWVIEVRL
jgi:hypothetical protein